MGNLLVISVAVAVTLLGAPVARAQAPAPAAAAVPDKAGDVALRRVLRSGCREGLAEVQALAGRADAPWAATVARLCMEILSAPAPAPLVPGAVVPAAAEPAHDGRGLLVVGFTLYGIWLGIATDVLFTIDGARSAIVPPLLGMAAGLGISLVASGDHPVTNSE